MAIDIGAYALSLIRQGHTPESIISQGLIRMTLLDLTRMLRQLTDTRPQAKAALAGAALEMAHSVIESQDPKVHLAALKGLNVIDDGAASGLTIIIGAGAAVQVNIGAKGQSEP